MTKIKYIIFIAIFLSTTYFTLATTRYVSLDGGNISPYTNWAAAATNIQTAIGAAAAGDTVIVSNGIYETGSTTIYGSMKNRIAINKAITVKSLYGPETTIIKGAGPIGNNAIRAVYAGANAKLDGFTITAGHTLNTGDGDQEQSGGGIWCESSATISNCIITGNSAYNAGGGINHGHFYYCIISNNTASSFGGGANDASIYYSTFTDNNSSGDGGGMYNSDLFNCLLIDNYASVMGGGGYGGNLNNCAITENTAGSQGGGTTYSRCCTTPPTSRIRKYYR